MRPFCRACAASAIRCPRRKKFSNAEYRGASGEDFIAALAVAYEIVCRFTDAVPFNTAGWDQPVTGAAATAMAAGRLLELSREALMHALALAELSMWKGCAGPNGARNGVFAALLAAEGMSGPYEAFDGVFGVWNQTLGGTAYDVRPCTALGARETLANRSSPGCLFAHST